jgi:eukaryotic-like serine/threonine-protein kinase
VAHSSRATLVGRTLQDKYRIDRVVGEGGFGVVYAGRHLTLDIAVAVKALLFQRDQSREQRAMLLSRFSDEAQILARLRHPNIVSVLDFGIVEDDALGAIPWLVLEWCEGETLDAELRRRRTASPRPTPRSIDEAWSLMRPIIDAIAYGHALGVAHRDLKPSNVMLVPCRTGVSPRVVDFGIAKRLEDNTDSGSGETLTNSGAAMFTPGYAAPEQVAMVRTGPWTDVHALGLIFTEMLTDQKPYPRQTGLVAAVDPQRPTPAQFGRDVGALEAVLAKAVALRPGERHPDAEAFLDELDGLLGTRRAQVLRPAALGDAHGTPLPEAPSAPDEMSRTGPGTLQASTSETSPRRPRSGRQWLVIGALAAAAIAGAIAVIALGSRPPADTKSALGAEPVVNEQARTTSIMPTPPAAATSAVAQPSASTTTNAAESAPARPPARPKAAKPTRPPATASPPPATARPRPALY